MKIKEPLLRILNKRYEASTMIEMPFKRYFLAFRTDEEGRPVLLFIGHKDEKGRIIGERYARRLATSGDGELIKDHWEHKGKAS